MSRGNSLSDELDIWFGAWCLSSAKRFVVMVTCNEPVNLQPLFVHSQLHGVEAAPWNLVMQTRKGTLLVLRAVLLLVRRRRRRCCAAAAVLL